MKPKPFVELNHFTVPVAIGVSSPTHEPTAGDPKKPDTGARILRVTRHERAETIVEELARVDSCQKFLPLHGGTARDLLLLGLLSEVRRGQVDLVRDGRR